MVNAVSAAGGEAKLIVLKDMGHNDAIDYADKHTNVLDWLLAQRKTNFVSNKETFSEWF